MSTKIYNGFRLPDMPFSALQALMDRFRAEALPVARDILARRVAAEVARIIDRATLAQPSKGITEPLAHVWRQVADEWRELKRDGIRHPRIDIECDVCFAATRRHILGIVFTEQPDLRDLWMRISGAQDLSYWDNTDPPEAISDAQWDDRRQAWDEVLPSGVPQQHAVALTLIGRHLPHIDRADVVAAQPALSARAGRHARDIALDEVAIPSAPGAPLHAFVESAMMASDALETDAGRARLAEITADVAAKLKPALTVADMLGWDPDAAGAA